MAEYKKNNRMGGTPARQFGKNNFASKELFETECNSCHNRCQVPFRPNGKKPVYCSNCFTKDNPKSTYTSSYHSDSQTRPHRNGITETNDRQLQELKREVQAMNATLKELVITIDTFNRSTALSREIQKHLPVKTPEVKKTTARKATAKAAAKVSLAASHKK